MLPVTILDPKLFNHFSDLISPHWKNLDETIINWINANPRLTAEHRKKLSKGCFGSLIARFYPSASYPHLITACRVMLFFFINDDNYHLHEEEELRAVHQRFITVLSGEEITEEEQDELCAMLQDIRMELEIFNRSDTWLKRFVASMDLYLEGVRMEAPFRLATRVPALGAYFEIRGRSIGTDVCYDLIEFVENIEMTPEQLQHPTVQEFKQLATSIIFLDNDLISMEKETGDVLNAVIIMKHTNATSEEQAVQDVIELRNALLSRFENLLLIAVNAEFRRNEAVRKYMYGIRKMVLGNYCWQCLDTGRYTGEN
ncbi:hypothetical protein ECE50_000635 [Chitinophaga sp. Mgbs1]|uniref:Terpene synthase n=1 Tax=Chitinophaga solisilvae TaxID=1233460 RepID=A0A3S1BLB1_9BACT|nr:hypothetical protein [Chitinophaga solisilvae]